MTNNANERNKAAERTLDHFQNAAEQAAARMAALEGGSATRVRLAAFSTPQNVVNTVAETFFPQVVVPANTLGTRNILPFEGKFLCTNNTGSPANFTFRVYFGGVLVLTIGPVSLTTSTARLVTISGELIANGVTNKQRVLAKIEVGVPYDTFSSTNLLEGATYNESTIDSTADQILKLSVQHGTANMVISTMLESLNFDYPIVAV